MVDVTTGLESHAKQIEDLADGFHRVLTRTVIDT